YDDASGGSDFPARYRAFLERSGSDTAETAVRETLGYDAASSELWERAIDVVARRVDRFLTLTGP
ncbi:MAG: hypothetical protein AAGJ97_12865, partial [Planctomycetota bacterium]